MIDGNFEQRLTLPGNGAYRIRLLRPDDEARLLSGFEQLSPESRYQRFFVVKNELTENELKRLTEYDSREQVALGIFELDGDREGACVAGGSVVRNAADATLGEVGITVIDRVQQLGLGTQLVELLIEAARERGIERLRFDVMAGNRPMRNLVKQLAPEARFDDRGDFLSAEVPIGEHGEATPASPMVQLLCAMMRIAQLGPVCLRPAQPAEPGTGARLPPAETDAPRARKAS